MSNSLLYPVNLNPFTPKEIPHCSKLVFWAFLMVSWILQIKTSIAQQGFPYCEPFSDGMLPANTVLGGNASLISGTPGNGVLRLTSNQEYQSGYVYLDIPFPSTFGIRASFEYFSYGGNGNADGLTFFLFDGGVPTFQPGAFGGALGYAQGVNPSFANSPGLS